VDLPVRSFDLARPGVAPPPTTTTTAAAAATTTILVATAENSVTGRTYQQKVPVDFEYDL